MCCAFEIIFFVLCVHCRVLVVSSLFLLLVFLSLLPLLKELLKKFLTKVKIVPQQR